MAPVGTVRIIWAGGENDFCIAEIGHILALEEACGVGIMHVFRRLESDTWKLHDLRETIRLGLIGGGLPQDKAMALVKIHVDQNPAGLAPSVLLAMEIIKAKLVGVPDDPLGKTAAAEAATGQVSSMTTAASAAPQSTAPAPRSAGIPEPSTA
jgi:hypothetical protein